MWLRKYKNSWYISVKDLTEEYASWGDHGINARIANIRVAYVALPWEWVMQTVFYYLLNPEPTIVLPVSLVLSPAFIPTSLSEHPQQVDFCRKTGWRTATNASKNYKEYNGWWQCYFMEGISFPTPAECCWDICGVSHTTRHINHLQQWFNLHGEARLASMPSSNWSQTPAQAIAALQHFNHKWQTVYCILRSSRWHSPLCLAASRSSAGGTL